MARRYNNSRGPYQTPFQTPQGQQRKNDEFPAHLLSSASSIQTDDSFLSQVPLPYHMKEDQSQMPSQDACFGQDPIRPSSRGSQSQVMTQSQDARFGQGPNRPSSRGSRAYMGYGNQRRPVSFAPIMEEAEIEKQTPIQTYAQGNSRPLSNIQGPPPAGPSFDQYNQQDQNQYGSNHGSSYNPYGGSNRGSNHGSNRGSDYGYDNRGNDNSNARMPRHMSLGNISSHYPTRQHEGGRRMSNVQSPFQGFVQGPPQDYNQRPPQGWGSQYDYRSSYHQGQYKGYQDQGFQNQGQDRRMSAGLNQGGDGDHGQIDSGGPAYPYTWNQNRFVRPSSNCEDGPSGFAGGQCGRYFKDPDFMVNKGAHERRRSVAGTPCYSNPLFNTHNGHGHNNKRRSLGDEAVMRPALMVANSYNRGSRDFQYEENEDTFIGSAINTPIQGHATLPAPTPRTARELGDAVTPSHPLVDTAKALELSVVEKEPPPAFGLDPIEESPTKRVGSNNIQDPFNLIAPPGHIVMAKGAGLNRGWSTTALSADENQCKVVSGQNLPRLIIGGPITTGPSPQLAALCPDGQKPTVAVAFDPINMPFVETARLHPTSAQTGVVHVFNVSCLTSLYSSSMLMYLQIPFKCSTQDILSIFGRGARLIAEEPVHVIMERVTSKTMDAFVEFETIEAAINAVDHFEQHRMNGNRGKLGARHVILEVCGHEVLMKCLFPKAKSVKWRGTYPEIIKETDKYNTGFKGFVSREELVMLVKHIEHPARVSKFFCLY